MRTAPRWCSAPTMPFIAPRATGATASRKRCRPPDPSAALGDLRNGRRLGAASLLQVRADPRRVVAHGGDRAEELDLGGIEGLDPVGKVAFGVDVDAALRGHAPFDAPACRAFPESLVLRE